MPYQNYTIGRGKVYVDKFLKGTETPTGERYVGNTPSLTLTSAYEDLPHYSSDQGVRVMDDNFTLQTDRSGSFSCDSINMDNVGLMFGSDPVDETIVSGTAQTSTLTDVMLDRWYQLGVSSTTPDGVGGVSNVDVTVAATPAVENTDYTVDLDTGRIYILPTATAIDDGDDLTVTFDVAASTSTVVVEEGEQIEGSLRFVADNPKGTNKDYFWPRVRIQPTGDFALKAEAWQTMTFNFAVLTPSDGRKRVYVRERTSAAA